MKVVNMFSNNGKQVPNHFIIRKDDGSRVFQSYDTIIAEIDKFGQVSLHPKYKYSVTTSKYRNIFLGETTKETEKKIKSGEYKIKVIESY
jgi:hypothetical protein